MKIFNSKKHEYKYQVSYCFKFSESVPGINEEMNFSGTGCMILISPFKIETESDIEQTNRNLMSIIKLDEGKTLLDVHLYSFNLLKQ